MKLGVFDHMDRGLAPLDRFYEERLKLVEAYDCAGFHDYHVAEHHVTPLGAVGCSTFPRRLAGVGRATNEAASFRYLGVSAAAVSSDQAAGGDLHARSD
jgi:alkanesulfonate monooxygenase SsuD/methylene tetrahydromethanopterin reductase-like flavin-dependent oxidoreductase (luciferase family)